MEPATTIAIIAVCIASTSTAVQKYMVDQDRVEEIKERINELQEKQKEGDEKDSKHTKEMMSLTKEMMIHNFKPLLYTFIPIILVIFWLRGTYEGTGVVATLPVVNFQLTWLWWYILISVIVSMSLEGVYKLYRKKKKKEED